jgi:hypothetical protein
MRSTAERAFLDLLEIFGEAPSPVPDGPGEPLPELVRRALLVCLEEILFLAKYLALRSEEKGETCSGLSFDEVEAITSSFLLVL